MSRYDARPAHLIALIALILVGASAPDRPPASSRSATSCRFS